MNNMQGQNQQQPNSGVTDIQELMRMGANSNNSDISEVDSILAEIGNEKQQQQQQLQVQQAQMQQQAQIQQQAQMQQHAHQQQAQAQQRMMINRQEELERANMEKDRMLRQMATEQKIENTNNINYDILNEMKPTIIVFIVVMIMTLPFINKFMCNSMGIEENAIYSILRTFIICVIFFLINKFV